MIRGYAAVWNTMVRPGNRPEPLIVLQGAFRLRGCQATLNAYHLEQPFAFAARGSLRLFQDDYGLGFEADALTHRARQLEHNIAAGWCTRASVGFGALRNSTTADRDGEMVEVISESWIEEISIVDHAGCPGTAVWLANMRPERMAPHAARLEARWRAGRAKAQAEVHIARPSAGGARRSELPDSVRTLMASPGWHEAMASSRAAAQWR